MMQYRREIDGLRALAVLPVIWYHAGFSFFSGGFLGVDVFFVISGYLITSIILYERERNTFTFLNFYERRVRRILPALFLVVIFSIPIAWVVMLPQDLKDFSQSVVAVNLFASNVLFQMESGYFDTEAELKPLLHTWSLAIEEQFYVLFPILLLCLSRVKRQSVYWIFGALALASLLIAQVGSQLDPDANFFFLLSRMWELLLGAILAFYAFSNQDLKTRFSQRTREIGSLSGMLLVMYAFFAFDVTTPSPSVYNMLPTIGTVMIILFANSETSVGRLLGSRILVGIGLISYSAYLWHNPIFTFARLSRIAESGSLTFFVLSLLSVFLAFISWRYIESPFRDKTRISRNTLFISCAACGLILASLGVAGHFTGGFENYYVNSRLNESEKVVYNLIKTHGGAGGAMTSDMGGDGECNFWMASLDDEFVRRFETCSIEHGEAVVVLGDSHAMNIYNALYRAELSPFLVSVSIGRCRPSEMREACHYDEFLDFAASHSEQIKYVLLHQTGFFLLKDRESGRQEVSIFLDNDSFELDMEHIESVMNYARLVSSHVDTYWLGPFAEARVDYRDLSNLATNGFSMSARSLRIFENLDTDLQSIAAEAGDIKYISLSEILQLDESFLLVEDCLTYRDPDHFSTCGEELIGDLLERYLDAELHRPI